MNLVQTNVVDAVDRAGRLIAELDGTDAHKAAQTFAETWEGGLIARIAAGEGPTMTKDELSVLSGRAWWTQDGIRFMRRYLDGTTRVYPEVDPKMYDGVERTRMADRVSDAVDRLASNAWQRGVNRIEQAAKDLDAELAVTDAKRYEEGLAEVKRLDAKGQLKAAILAMTDPHAKKQMMERYPELFSRDALSAMAQARSHAKHRK